jgi:putative transcriptional regulator
MKKAKRRPYDRIMDGLEEALAHAKGENVPGLVVHVPVMVDVAAIRGKTKLSQQAFANTIGVPVTTLQNWEQKRRSPHGPARVLLAMLDRNPKIVEEILGAKAA